MVHKSASRRTCTYPIPSSPYDRLADLKKFIILGYGLFIIAIVFFQVPRYSMANNILYSYNIYTEAFTFRNSASQV